MSDEIDLTRYERDRAAHHEQFIRTLATWIDAPLIKCLIRKCRRDGRCSGPMLRSSRQNARVRTQKALGLSGDACATLPACLACCGDAYYARVEEAMKILASGLAEKRVTRLLRFDRCLNCNRWPRDTPSL